MIVPVDLTDAERDAIRAEARDRAVRILAGSQAETPADRALARLAAAIDANPERRAEPSPPGELVDLLSDRRKDLS